MYTSFLALHIVGFTIWMTGLFAAALILAHKKIVGESLLLWKSKLTRTFGIIADLGATVALTGGIYMLFASGYWRQPWMHIKLTLVVVFIVLHSWIRRYAKRPDASFPSSIVAILVLIFFAIVALAVFRTPVAG